MIETALFRLEHLKTDDSGDIQRVDILGYANEQMDGAIRPQPHGFTSVPPKGSNGIGLRARGMSELPIILGLEHEQVRPKNFKPGESAHYDDQKQISKLARDGHYATAKKHVFTAGNKPDTTFELNEQLKGLSARVAQAEHNLHGLFDATSKFREIVQGHLPDVQAVEQLLNKDPSGLKNMADAILGKEQDYLQKQVTQALEKFLSPNLAGLQSLLGGGLEASIAQLQEQVASMVGSNPIIAQVDALVDELSSLTASEADASIIQAGTTALQTQITALTAANPIVGQINGLRNALEGLVSQAGPALNFLAPQKRLVQGISKSLHLSNPG